MGVCTNGDIQIELQTEEDADYVYDQLLKIEELTVARTGFPASFNLQDNHVDGTLFLCNVYSDRIPNGEFQIQQVIIELQRMVKEGKIHPPYEFTAELLVQHQGWSMSENDFTLNTNDDE